MSWLDWMLGDGREQVAGVDPSNGADAAGPLDPQNEAWAEA